MNRTRKKTVFTMFIALLIGVYVYFFGSMPSYDRQAIFSVPQSSIITDRDGEELFRFFDEDRRRVEYDQIAPSLIDAIVVTEDQSFRSNKGIDSQGIIRAIINNTANIFGANNHLQGASTITQQLVKNIFLTNEKTLKRKIQEARLAIILTKKETQHQYKKATNEGSPLSYTQSRIKAKKSIMSMYLNYVYFGNKAYGIESAAQNYFHKPAIDLTLLESSILASLPQAPSLYNPVLDTKKVLGHRYVISGDQHMIYETITTGDLMSSIQKQLTGTLNTIDSTRCLDSIQRQRQITGSIATGSYYQAYYQPGRKDHILCQLFQNQKITLDQFKQALFDTSNTTVHRSVLPIQTPHFVFWIKDFIQSLPLQDGKNIADTEISKRGYTIQTTIDMEHQQSAQQAIDSYITMLKKNGANNRALLHVDSSNGDVLAYIGSQDFYNTEIQGQNDIIQARHQAGSLLKPFIYGYFFDQYDKDIDHSVRDVPLSKGPQNHDLRFRGKMTYARALAASRNLPTVRIYLALGGDETFVPLLQKLGFIDLDSEKSYGYPLVLGAGEHTMTQLAGAYSQLSITGSQYHHVNPITRISDAQGHILYEKSIDSPPVDKSISDSAGQMIRDILATNRYMPADRWPWRMMPLTHFALKTGTSDKKLGKETFPRDARMTLYTTHDVIVSRAGNTDGSAMRRKAFGGSMNYYIIKKYLELLKQKNAIIDEPRNQPINRKNKRKELTPAQLNILRGRK